MRTFVALLIAVLFASSAGAAERPQPAERRGVAPVAELRSTGTAIVDFVAGSGPVVAGRTSSRLEARLAPGADQIANMAHAVFVLADGTVVMKAIMYRWTTPVDLQIALPYSDQWDVRAVYVGGITDYAKNGTIAPLFLSGRDFSAGLAAAPVIAVDDDSRVESNLSTDCYPTAGGCQVCFDCWWNFCSDPYSRC